ncbi:MAG: DUF2164 domain-containing protein [Gemmatimonadota bacterium]
MASNTRRPHAGRNAKVQFLEGTGLQVCRPEADTLLIFEFYSQVLLRELAVEVLSLLEMEDGQLMKAKLSKEVESQMRTSIRRFFLEDLEQEIGDLKAGNVLDYFLKELAPTVYNLAVADAQAYFQQRTADLDGACYEKEFTFWLPTPKGKGRP